jgi:hypothetical protein
MTEAARTGGRRGARDGESNVVPTASAVGVNAGTADGASSKEGGAGRAETSSDSGCPIPTGKAHKQNNARGAGSGRSTRVAPERWIAGGAVMKERGARGAGGRLGSHTKRWIAGGAAMKERGARIGA